MNRLESKNLSAAYAADAACAAPSQWRADKRKIRCFAVTLLVFISSTASLAQTTREAAPDIALVGANAASTADRSLLVELNRETQGLYRELQGGILRVQVPETVVARNAGVQNNWIVSKYSGLNNEMRQRLTENGNGALNNSGSASNPGSNGADGHQQSSDLNNSITANNGANPTADGQNTSNLTIIVPAMPQEQQAQQRGYAAPVQLPPQANVFSPNNIGLLIDNQGHVLVPQYVDRESVGDRPIHLSGAGGVAMEGRLVGSDQQTGLAVLQLIFAAADVRGAATFARQSKPDATTDPTTRTSHPDVPLAGAAQPVKLAKAKPVDGSLVLLLSPGGGTGRLAVWNGGGRDYGVVVNIDGQIAGITRYGQFLSGAACQLIADQIIRNGSVRRATLGVIITQIEKDDVLRHTQPLLGDRPAVRVDEVVARSVADRGGLRPGDILLSLDGEPATDIPTLAAAIASKDGCSRLRVLRGDEEIELTVDLQRR
jgi:hypothetical protein